MNLKFVIFPKTFRKLVLFFPEMCIMSKTTCRLDKNNLLSDEYVSICCGTLRGIQNEKFLSAI